MEVVGDCFVILVEECEFFFFDVQVYVLVCFEGCFEFQFFMIELCGSGDVVDYQYWVEVCDFYEFFFIYSVFVILVVRIYIICM